MLQRWFMSYRSETGLSLKEVSRKTGIPVSRLSEVQNGRVRNPSLRYLLGFSKALECRYLFEFIRMVELEG